VLEILKIVLPFLSGGLAGAVLSEWLRRRHGKVQAIPLIERVNRLVNPGLKGFTLARVTGGGAAHQGGRQLEEVKNVREYQLSLQNTSTVHLQDVEIQFEFPTEDVEAWASRPVRSKTAPVSVDPVVTEPWKKGFRWRIPHLPSTDSIEFTFRAVDTVSGDYEVALYKSDRIVIEKSKGEPAIKSNIFNKSISTIVSLLGLSLSLIAVPFALISAYYENGRKQTTLREGGVL
jgi:hypothetical protein